MPFVWVSDSDMNNAGVNGFPPPTGKGGGKTGGKTGKAGKKGKGGGKSGAAGKRGGAGFMASADWITCPTQACRGKWFNGDNTPVRCKFCKQPTDLSLREGRPANRGQAGGR